jgi:3-deoxy-D-manno-octulosonic-acid transferase
MFIYNLVVRLYALLIFVASAKNIKAKQWVQGRRQWRTSLRERSKHLKSRRVWVHCASYGEFEQGRPLIEAIRQKHPDYAIVLSFFSPSGYEAFKDWNGADLICYLPLDTKSNVRDFVEIVKPQTVIFIKYEFWLHFLFRLRKLEIPTFLVSAVFKPHHPFFKWYGGFFRRSLQTFTRLFIQDEGSAKLLKNIGIKNYEVCGDTRFDRVVEIRNNFKPLPYFEDFCKNRKVLIAGSSWPKDEELLLDTFQKFKDPDLRLIFAPHHIDEKTIRNLEELIRSKGLQYLLYSDQKRDAASPVLIINTIGLLNKIYHYADVTYIGGGFNSGIHNCLEPAVYLKPVLFHGGDDYEKYNEAVELLNMGAARNVSTVEETKTAILHFLNNPQVMEDVKKKLNVYFEKNSGTTEKVLASIHWE